MKKQNWLTAAVTVLPWREDGRDKLTEYDDFERVK